MSSVINRGLYTLRLTLPRTKSYRFWTLSLQRPRTFPTFRTRLISEPLPVVYGIYCVISLGRNRIYHGMYVNPVGLNDPFLQTKNQTEKRLFVPVELETPLSSVRDWLNHCVGFTSVFWVRYERRY